jgi:death-on-curing protein
LALHAESVRRHGGKSGGVKDGCVDGSLGAAWNAEAYLAEENAQRGLVFAAHLLYYLARNHCFVDGNKRAGWLAMTEVLGKFDLTLATDAAEAEAFVNGIASGEVKRAEDVVPWLAARLAYVGDV